MSRGTGRRALVATAIIGFVVGIAVSVRYDLVARSDALNLFASGGKTPSVTKLANVVLAAPDVDADTFRGLAAAIRKTAGSMTLYASARDKALQVSRTVNGAPRAGEPIIISPGLDSIDASEIDTDFLQHGYFSDARSMLEDLFGVFRGTPARALDVERTR